MIELHVIGQTIRHSSPNIAADSYNYLEVQCWFAGNEWEGYDKWLHFKQGDTEYTLALDENGRVTAEAGLNLSTGEWEVFLTGSTEISRITTIPIIINVYQSGLINAPLGELPMTVAEQVATKANAALTLAREVSDKAAAGEFDGKSFEISDYYDSLAELQAAVTEPESGMLYGVGTTPPLDIYGWSEEKQAWINNGKLQGAQGERGKDGPYYQPSVDGSGNLSWTNNGGLENPASVNIRGPQGAQGAQGKDGKGPYEFAREGGYTGTAETLMEALVMVPEHHTRHEAGGLDPITVTGKMIEDKTITRAKLAADALCGQTKTLTATEYSFAEGDAGYMYVTNGNTSDFTFTLTQEVSSKLPAGAEITVLWLYAKSVTIKGEGVRFAVAGDTAVRTSATVNMTEKFGVVGLKRLFGSSGSGDCWMVQGMVEVAT